MISIVISEKGGAERREIYDQDEVTIGRVKGNDVLLPKGNVSKRHARLIMRDGRYIVTDLKSTNGTYVNHRRITHATLVREGDRIYIGDFILRLESATRPELAPGPETAGSMPHSPGASSTRMTDDGGMAGVESSTAGGSNPRAGSQGRAATIPPAPGGNFGHSEEIVSHFPIENDPDDSSPMIDVPAPPRMPTGLRNAAAPGQVAELSRGSTVEVAPIDSAAPSPPAIIPPTSSTGQFSGRAESHRSSGTADSSPQHPSDATPPAKSSHPALEEARRAANWDALCELVEDIETEVGAEALDELPRPRDEVAQRVAEILNQRVAQASLPADVDGAALRDAARRELLDLGPLEALLEDDNITRIRVALRDVSILRRGQPATHDGTFGSPSGLLRAIRRLCADAGLPITDGEVVVERELSGGRRLSALLPPAAVDGPVLLVQRSRTASTTLNALVRSGTISRGMATLLAHCMTARANMLIVGPPGQGVEEVSSAFGAAAGRGSQLLTIGDDDFGGRAIRLTLRGDELEQASVVVAAARLAPDHLVVRPLSGKPLAALLDAIADGLAGVVLQNPSPTLRQAVDRLAVDVAAARDIGLSAAREWVSRAFDLGIEVSRLKDGRLRVVRIAELRSGSQSGQRDIFTFNYHRTAAGGAIEGSFFASGTVPGVVEDLAARGMPLDTTIFRRHPSG